MRLTMWVESNYELVRWRPLEGGSLALGFLELGMDDPMQFVLALQYWDDLAHLATPTST